MTENKQIAAPPRVPDEVGAQWDRVRGHLRAEFGNAAYKSWLQPISLTEISRGRVSMQVPTRFMREWVMSRYADRIRALWRGEDSSIRSIHIAISGDGDKAAPAAAPASDTVGGQTIAAPSDASPSPAPVSSPEKDLDPSFVSTLNQRFSFDNFVVGKSNEFAHAAARRVAESIKPPFNPLFIYGGVGLGKTHLMHAIAWQIRKTDPSRRVIYLSAEKFMYQFIRALRFQNTMAFKELFRSVDVLMIDDVQFIGGKNSTQEEFFHTFNALIDRNRQVVITGDRSPSDLDGMEERLRSRLGWGLVADIHPTDYELRLGILQSKAEQIEGVEMPLRVLEFLAHKITSSVRELEGALNRVVAHATLVGREVTLEATQEILQDVLRAHDRRITIEEIQKRVAAHFNIRLGDMHSARRARNVARPRQVAMYLAKQLTSRSLPEIGRKFGGRDHTTVMHGVKRVEQLRETDAAFAEDIDLLRRMIES
ncbi:MAG: chromosomal replication initiator protein DnaA [Proteobacteria bacterium]|nr:chromosomal replication initiator protein DnaA [Pseudomonadota bacterium]